LDTLDFSATETQSISVNLALRTAQVVNPNLTLTVANDRIERILGGAQSDTLIGSFRNNILVGNGGDDTLTGGDGRDLLIGGDGLDTLRAEGGEDLLIGGRTSHDANLAALDAIMAEWSRTDRSYSLRIDHLTGAVGGGSNGSVRLNASTVRDDAGAADILEGGSLVDWFFEDQNDQITDRNTGGTETVSVI
jgi:Ca2+-binding RTX toxin-like protein